MISNVENGLYALVIDDEALVSNFAADVLAGEGWIVSEARNAEEAFELLLQKTWALVLCDVMLGEINGYEVLRRFVEHQPEARVVLMTGQGSAVGALDATAFGAYDYLLKPFSVDDIVKISKVVYEQHHRQSKSEKSKSESKNSAGYTSDIPLIGKSPKFVECLKMVGRVAATNLPVLITGESGTGKEVVARAIHLRSPRANRKFVAVNCGAIPVELIESELFGHVRGSFTGAVGERTGLWEEAHEGTIFLDEITETNPLFQVKLLRALQEGEIRRVGSNQSRKLDVRVIAATNRDIEEEVSQNRFRQDLMFRLNAVTIHLPPLRERVEDIAPLAEHFARKVYGETSATLKFSGAALELMKNYDWQGNIRELENAVFHAASLSDGVVYPEHLPQRVINCENAFGISDSPKSPEDNWLTLAEMEAKYVAKVLTHTGGNKQSAARILNIDRKTLTRIVKRGEES